MSKQASDAQPRAGSPKVSDWRASVPMASRGERFRAGGTPSSPAVVALVALSFLARLCSALQGTEMDLSIDWLSECGCTGIEIESVGPL